ncbi:hypothetical protein [Acidovorax sp.]|uniref:hypothetical protein n=1 Tax=Acidovorax sp. TaxID=1872122 RepID=UPI00391FC76C
MASIKRFFFVASLIIGSIAFMLANFIFIATPRNLNELKVVTGRIKHAYYHPGNPSTGNPLRGAYRSGSPPSINLTVMGSDVLFTLIYEQERLNKINNAPKDSIVKVTYQGSGSVGSVWGLELNGVVIEKPEDHLKEDKTLYIRLYYAAGFFIAIAILLSKLTKSQPENRSERNHSRSAGASKKLMVENDPQPFKGVLHIIGLVAGGLWGAMFVRWYYLYVVPKTELGAGGTLFMLVTIFPLILGITLGYFFVMVGARPIPSVARVLAVFTPFLIAFFGFVLPMQINSAKSKQHEKNALAIRSSAANQNTVAGGAQQFTPKELREIFALKMQTPHAAPGVIPSMLSVSPSGSGFLIGNRSNNPIKVQISRVLPVAGTWEHCDIGFEDTPAPAISWRYRGEILPGHGKIYNYESCAERFKNASIEYVVFNSTDQIIFRSESSFYRRYP